MLAWLHLIQVFDTYFQTEVTNSWAYTQYCYISASWCQKKEKKKKNYNNLMLSENIWNSMQSFVSPVNPNISNNSSLMYNVNLNMLGETLGQYVL